MNGLNSDSTNLSYRRVDLNWCEFLQKQWPQLNAVSPEIFLFFNSGLIVGTILYDANFLSRPWAQNLPHTFIALSAITYFLGVILGVNVSTYFVRKCSKRNLKHFPCLLFIITGILLLLAPSITASVVTVRTLTGFATGIIQLNYLVQGAEVSVSKMRGIVLSTFSITYAAGICASAVIQLLDTDKNEFQAYQIIGILHIILTIFAELSHVFFNAESPVFLLENNDLEGAVRTMMKLRNESIDSWDIRNDVQEMALMLDEDRSVEDRSVFRQGNLRPLCLISATILLPVLCSNFPLNIIKIKTVDTLITTNNNYFYGEVILVSIKLFTTIVAVYTVDFFGRKRPLFISALGAGLMVEAIGILLWLSKRSTLYLTESAWGFIALEVLVNFGCTFLPYVYVGEAFCTPKKTLSIAFVLSLENFIQIIMLVSTYGYLMRRQLAEIYLIPTIIGLFTVILSLILMWLLPDTSNISIRESAKKFRNLPTAVEGIPYS